MDTPKKNVVYLRGDAGRTHGWGHLNRLLSLAFILKDYFELVCVSGEEGATLFQQAAGSFVGIRKLPAEEQGECSSEWPGAYQENAILVLDGYHFDAAYRNAAKKKGFKVVLVDDFAEGPFNSVDLILNHAPGSDAHYEMPVSTSKPELCCGIGYAMLRPEFYEPVQATLRREKQVLISMGGADPLGYTARLLEALVEQRPDYRWIAVCTHSFLDTHLQKLRLLETQHKNITLLFHLAAPEMHRLMLSSEKAIVSSSTVLLEAWASGLYAAAICYTSNQAFIYQGAVSQGMAFGIDINQPEAGVLKYLDTKGISGSRTGEWNPPQHILKAFLRLAYA